ncbi:hypothetical protein [Ornithinimicrobium kibberense]|uniref:hypothetical protein n=1 Tax=Ornithinimicrobium kibberense TaxID=282060 RepID=UPI00361A1278
MTGSTTQGLAQAKCEVGHERHCSYRRRSVTEWVPSIAMLHICNGDEIIIKLQTFQYCLQCVVGFGSRSAKWHLQWGIDVPSHGVHAINF